MKQEDIQNIRSEYLTASLTESDANADPIKQFDKWFNEALKAELQDPTAMTLATATHDGRPSSRVVLMKGFDNNGFVFYTIFLGDTGKTDSY